MSPPAVLIPIPAPAQPPVPAQIPVPDQAPAPDPRPVPDPPGVASSTVADSSIGGAPRRRHLTTADPFGEDSLGERTSCALATRMAKQIVDILVNRRALPTIRSEVTVSVARVLATTHDFTREGPGFRMRSVHASLTTTRTVEACAVVGTAHRARALVLRLEQAESRWLCTLLAVL